jgi:hypothetical protein
VTPISLGIFASANQSVPGTSFESIATITPGDGTSNVEFTSIPATYSHLQVRLIARGSSADSYFTLQFNGDTASNYSWHQLYGDGSSTGSSGGSSASSIVSAQFSNVTSSFGAGVIDILDYTSTNKAKTVRLLSGFDSNGSGKIVFRSGGWYKNTSSVYDAITSIKLTPVSGTIQNNSHFALYGIKSA